MGRESGLTMIPDRGPDRLGLESRPALWERLEWNASVSFSSPVVRGTMAAVDALVSLVIDGWTWSDIMRAHPELSPDDIRACLAYQVEQDHGGPTLRVLPDGGFRDFTPTPPARD